MYTEELSYTQQLELIEQLIEELSQYPEEAYPGDRASEILDSWMPVYYSDIREHWVEAGCPDPDELMPDNNKEDQLTIHNLMTLGLWEVANNFVNSAIWGTDGEANTHAEAVENIKENYSHLIAEKVIH
jgi:hypothetical protein